MYFVTYYKMNISNLALLATMAGSPIMFSQLSSVKGKTLQALCFLFIACVILLYAFGVTDTMTIALLSSIGLLVFINNSVKRLSS